MSPEEKPLMVIGHKNPDTDSICSAIAYSHYKQEVAGVPALPYRAGNLNPQTAFVLDHFGVKEPQLLTTLLPKLSDIMIRGEELLVLQEDQTVGAAQDLITRLRFAFLPVLDATGKYAGRVSSLRLAGLPQDLAGLSGRPDVVIHVPGFIGSIGGKVVSGTAPASFRGAVWLQGLGADPAAGAGPLLAVIPSADKAALAAAKERGADIIVVCSTLSSDSLPAFPQDGHAACVVVTPHPALEVAVRLCLSMPLDGFIERQHATFKPHDLVRDVRREVRKSNEGGFVVVDENGFIAGVITRLSFLNQARFRVALVDHNELSQSLEGVEEANVEEVIDHHRLGYRSTDQPITFINKVVGCTCTIIGELYRNARREPPREIAGLMLAAILSDTVILQSPTTTPLDHEMAEWLAGLAGEDVQAFGAKMFAAGCALEHADPRTLVRQDLKVYEESGWKLSVSQMETVGFDAFRNMSKALAAELDAAREESGCDFGCLMVTDITSSTSLLLCAGEEKIIRAITYPKAGENLFKMSGVLSRKKQMMPYFADLLRQL